MGRNIKLSSKHGTVVIVNGEPKSAREQRTDLQNLVADELVQAMVEVAADAERNWPRRTGRSAKAFRVTQRTVPGGVTVGIRNRAVKGKSPYPYLIRTTNYGGKEGRKVHAWSEVRRAAERAGLDAIGDAMDKARDGAL